MTVRFQSRQETEWVRKSLHAPRLRLNSYESRTCLLSYCAQHGGTPCPRLYLGRQIWSLTAQKPRACSDSQCFWARDTSGAPPPLLAGLQEAELSLGLAVGGGAEGSVSPHPTPQIGFPLGDRLCRQQQPPLPPPPHTTAIPHSSLGHGSLSLLKSPVRSPSIGSQFRS